MYEEFLSRQEIQELIGSVNGENTADRPGPPSQQERNGKKDNVGQNKTIRKFSENDKI